MMKSIYTRYHNSYASKVVNNHINEGNPYLDCLDSIPKYHLIMIILIDMVLLNLSDTYQKVSIHSV